MDWVVVAILAMAVMFAFLRGVGWSAPDSRPDFGWLAISCLIFAVWFLPAAWQLRTNH